MRTLNDIIPPSRRKEAESLNQSATNGREPSRFSADNPRRPSYITVFVIVLVIIVSVGALFYFSSAKIEVTPSTISGAVRSSFTANKESGNLPFKVITAEKIASKSVKGSGTKVVNSYASGPITIYNTQSQAQKLITNTRFATTAGLIFRIHSAITIPGGSASKPGSITVTVYADQAGDTYNVAPTSFTVPGLAGTPQANAVYARSSSAMAGGASGSVPVVDGTLESQARSSLISALDTDLISSIKSQVPTGYTLLAGAATTTYREITSAPSSTAGMVDIKEQGTISAVIFPDTALAKAIASSIVDLNYQGEPLTLASSSSLTLTTESGKLDTENDTFDFYLSGTASFVYTVDPSRIASAVSGKTRSAAEVALTNYPEVKRAIIILRPFWKQTFPQDPSSISVVMSDNAY